jgi:hypothetical protein
MGRVGLVRRVGRIVPTYLTYPAYLTYLPDSATGR